MAFIVTYDASVLYPNTLRDLLIRIAQASLVQARWTNQIPRRIRRSIPLWPLGGTACMRPERLECSMLQ